MSRLLVYVSLIATLALGAHAEYKVGVFVGLDGELVWGLTLAMALPVAIDCYVLAALLADRDVPVALAVLALSIGGGHVYIGAAENDAAKAVTGGAVGLLLVAVLWRVEELAKHDAHQRAGAKAAREASSPVASSPAPGEHETAVPGDATGAPPVATKAPRGRSPKTTKGTRDAAAAAYVAACRQADKRPSRDGLIRAVRDAGHGIGTGPADELLKHLTQPHAVPEVASA